MATINGGPGDDTLGGGTGDDVMHGFTGNDVLYGRRGNDRIFGDAQRDTLNGGAGADTITGGLGVDVMIGGTGVDTLLDVSNDDYQVDLATGLTGIRGERAVEFEHVLTGDGNDVIRGSAFGNIIRTSGGNDRLVGEGGNDSLYGGSGADLAIGGTGADFINGGLGFDTLTGGGGSDSFVFTTDPRRAGAGADRVRDFNHAADVFRLDDEAFITLPRGTLKASAFHIGDEATAASHRIVYDQQSGRIYFDADGSGVSRQFLVAQLDAGTFVARDDFVVF